MQSDTFGVQLWGKALHSKKTRRGTAFVWFFLGCFSFDSELPTAQRGATRCPPPTRTCLVDRSNSREKALLVLQCGDPMPLGLSRLSQALLRHVSRAPSAKRTFLQTAAPTLLRPSAQITDWTRPRVPAQLKPKSLSRRLARGNLPLTQSLRLWRIDEPQRKRRTTKHWQNE